jgi:hypothetical protein
VGVPPCASCRPATAFPVRCGMSLSIRCAACRETPAPTCDGCGPREVARENCGQLGALRRPDHSGVPAPAFPPSMCTHDPLPVSSTSAQRVSRRVLAYTSEAPGLQLAYHACADDSEAHDLGCHQAVSAGR